MNMTIKELQATCDDLYYQFVCRLSKVTDFETIDKGDCNTVCLYTDKNHDDCISITRWNDSNIWFWLDDFNGLLIGTSADHDLIDIRLNKVLGLKRDLKRYTSTIYRVLGPKRDFKRYTSTKSDKPLHQKKRAILLELKTKLEALLNDYL